MELDGNRGKNGYKSSENTEGLEKPTPYFCAIKQKLIALVKKY